MPYARFFPALAVALLLGGCSDDGVTGVRLPTDRATVAAAAVAVMVPIQWSYTMMPIPGDFGTCINSDDSPPFFQFPINYVTTGKMTHLGVVDPNASYSYFNGDCLLTLVDGVPVSTSGGAVAHIVGANGDAIDFSGTLSLDFASFSATGEWTITGGTGRFQGASGWLESLEFPSASGSGSQGHATGMITPPGMLRH
jgi:hypothetical protein